MTQLSDSLAPPEEPARSGTVVFPASREQRQLWLAEQLEPSSAYHVPCVLRLRGALDRVALQGALDALVARHEPLRTAFVERDGQVLQVIQAESEVRIEVEELGGGGERERAARERAEVVVRHRFDLAAAPLV